MKITFISHAALLIETDGIAILSDPWWNGPSFAQQWWNYPQPAVEQLAGRKIDYIYISHGHNDHLHAETLQTLCRDAVVIISASSHLAELPRELGFTVREIAPNEEAALTKRVRVRLMPTHSRDTLLAVSDGEEVCINLNDALHSAPRRVQDEFLKTLRSLYPKIDYVFCGYAIASHFPNCYRVAGKDQVLTAQLRQRHFTEQWVRIVATLDPRFAFPFAGDVVLLDEDLMWVNESTHNTERPPEVLKKAHPGFAGQAIDPGPGFQVADGRILRDIRRPIVRAAGIRQDLKDQIERAQRYEPVEWGDVEEIHGLLVTNIATCSSYLQSFDGDYRCLVRFRSSNFGVVIRKQGKQVSATTCRDAEADSRSDQLVFSTRLAYLKSSLTIPYGDEVIFVGSGGIFEFKRREDLQKALHRELAAIIRRHDSVPVRGADKPRTLKSHVKRFVLKLLGREESDLYDLDRWTVYSGNAVQAPDGPAG